MYHLEQILSNFLHFITDNNVGGMLVAFGVVASLKDLVKVFTTSFITPTVRFMTRTDKKLQWQFSEFVGAAVDFLLTTLIIYGIVQVIGH